jgi:hypothetical protein
MRIATTQFIYCCPQKFSTLYRKTIKEFKKTKCVILELNEEILPCYFSPRKSLCSKCREHKSLDGVRVTIKYEIPN